MQPEGSVGVVARRQEHLDAATLERKRDVHVRLRRCRAGGRPGRSRCTPSSPSDFSVRSHAAPERLPVSSSTMRTVLAIPRLTDSGSTGSASCSTRRPHTRAISSPPGANSVFHCRPHLHPPRCGVLVEIAHFIVDVRRGEVGAVRGPRTPAAARRRVAVRGRGPPRRGRRASRRRAPRWHWWVSRASGRLR